DERRWPEEATPPVAAEGAAVADELGCTPGRGAAAGMLARPPRPTVVPIVGNRTAAQLTSTLAALDVELAPEHLERLDAAGAPKLGFPRAFLESRALLQLV